VHGPEDICTWIVSSPKSVNTTPACPTSAPFSSMESGTPEAKV
jgi:hypothetical protein